MKQLFPLIITTFTVMSCYQPTLHYSDFKDHQISFQNIFLEKEDHWIYFYEETCYHCQKIEQEVLSFLQNTSLIFYLVNDIPVEYFNTNYQKAIGASKVEDVLIPGYPTLIQIENQKISQFYVGTSAIQKWIGQEKK
ncbi:immunity/modification protein [Coprobacillus sp. CAG:826]|nr:immunity/modification protein [Coprobacillus sp. CAG:826]